MDNTHKFNEIYNINKVPSFPPKKRKVKCLSSYDKHIRILELMKKKPQLFIPVV